jgi:hypothetical protein
MVLGGDVHMKNEIDLRVKALLIRFHIKPIDASLIRLETPLLG